MKMVLLMKSQVAIWVICFSILMLTGCEEKENASAEVLSEESALEEELVVPEGENPERWEDEISAFEVEDQLTSPPEGSIVFVGSSSIRLWESLKDDMDPLPVIKRGFGGSKLFDAIYFTDRIITPYKPEILVVFSGTNDISGNNPKQAEEVVALYKQFVERVHRRMPDLPIYFIAISPTRSRWEHRDIVFETNRRVAAITESDERLYFIDTASALLDESGEPNDGLFLGDNLHLNKDGYAVWTSIIKPVLVEKWGSKN